MRYMYAGMYAVMMVLGWFYPIVALAVFFFMGAIILSGKRKQWCGNYCPRGSFLDKVMYHVSPRKPLPRWMFGKKIFAVAISLFMTALGVQIHLTGLLYSFEWIKAGMVLYRMCLVSSMIAIPLALFRHQRGWCAVCPVGNILRK